MMPVVMKTANMLMPGSTPLVRMRMGMRMRVRVGMRMGVCMGMRM